MAFNLSGNNLFYRLTRRIFGVSEYLRPHWESIACTDKNAIEQDSESEKYLETLRGLSRLLHPLTLRLTGMKQLTALAESHAKATKQRAKYYKENTALLAMQSQRREEIRSIKTDVREKINRGSYNNLMDHFSDKDSLIKTQPKFILTTIPNCFEIFGAKQQIHANALMHEGKPATYRHLMDVIAANEKMKATHCQLLDKYSLSNIHSNRENPYVCQYDALRNQFERQKEWAQRMGATDYDKLVFYSTYSNHFEELRILNVRIADYHKTYFEPLWRKARDVVDGCFVAQNYAKRGLKWIKQHSFWVEMEPDTKDLIWKYETPTCTQESAISKPNI